MLRIFKKGELSQEMIFWVVLALLVLLAAFALIYYYTGKGDGIINTLPRI